MTTKSVRLQVDSGGAGRTATALLKAAAGVSHAVARGLIDQGLVTVNGRRLTDPVRRLASGDTLEARFDPGARYRARPPLAVRSRGDGFQVVLEEETFVVVDKQAGVMTVPAPSHPSDTLVDRLLGMYQSRGVREPRLWVVHRIDRFTSGLVLFARDERAFASLAGQFEKRSPAREYLAICHGIPDPPERRLESWLVENPKSLKVSATADTKLGRRAVSRFVMESPLVNAALLRVTLETGRRHQIRVQLAEAGHPLVGDRTYGVPSPVISRVSLHAARLGFAHPVTGARVSVETPLPADMRRALRILRHPPAP